MKNQIRNIALSGLAAIIITTSGCGLWNKTIEQSASYQTLVGKKGHITFYLGNGNVLNDFPDAKVVYSSSDSRCLWIEAEGKEYYWQGDAKVELKK